MCGITAVFGKFKEKEKFVKSSLKKIIHRGINSYEYKVFDKGALGANRLPLVGRENGHQPRNNFNETIFAVQNGEIFNHKELRKNLEDKGYIFSGDSDTEVLAHLYEDIGEDMIYELDSEMYAFVIYDKKNNDFFVAKDRWGVKPLFYAQDKDKNWYFASELKQLTQFAFIEEVNIFPKGHYMKNGKLFKYYEPVVRNSIKNEGEASQKLTKVIVDAVRKRVDTDLPIAVLLSGGVDSSLVMEIATRFHKDVKAFILGKPGSPDYEAAVKLCKERKYNYQIVFPDVDYVKEFEQLIYHLESYEAQVIRQSFALDILAKAVVRDGYRIALVGDAADEIFGGYNEFNSFKSEDINHGCIFITNSFERGHNIRLDRMSMKHTLEIRAPFFDNTVMELAFKIDGKLKVKRENHRVIVKYILRKVASNFLPGYIAWRYKVPFSNGAGMNVGFNYRTQDGDVAKSILTKKFKPLSKKTQKKYGFLTDEEESYFGVYGKNEYTKLKDNYKRIITKDNLPSLAHKENQFRILIAEFGRMPLYFPLYYAVSKGLFKKEGIDVDFIESGGDDLTFGALLSGSAQIGIADPTFTFSENSIGTNGKIIGSLINKVPLVAVSLKPDLKIDNLSDFEKYKLGTYQKFSTTNTLIRNILPKNKLYEFNFKELSQSLANREIDIAIMTLDYAKDLETKGGKIIYSFKNDFGEYFFTGINISDSLDPIYQKKLNMFMSVVKTAINDIKKNKKEATKLIKKEFPEFAGMENFLEEGVQFWNTKLDINKLALVKAQNTWKNVYPWMLKNNQPNFIEPTKEDEIVSLFNKSAISRDIPYKEEELRLLITKALKNKESLKLFGFWGISSKKKINESDLLTINNFKKLSEKIKVIMDIEPEFTFIISDQHAILNSFDEKEFIIYINQIKKELDKFKFKHIQLSKLWEKYSFTTKKLFMAIDNSEDKEYNDLRNKKVLENSAKKLGFENYKFEAKRYYFCRKLESKFLEKEFKGYIYHTFSEDTHQSLMPKMPTLYLWTSKRGDSKSPWFCLD